jgi:hypothetical protein
LRSSVGMDIRHSPVRSMRVNEFSGQRQWH